MGDHALTGEQLLEERIEDAYQCLLSAHTREGKQAAWEAMRDLCQKRTAETVLHMEREKGLA